jgi:hypothetical protein
MASSKGIDGKREIFSFQDIYLLTKILGSLIVVPSKHMASYKKGYCRSRFIIISEAYYSGIKW